MNGPLGDFLTHETPDFAAAVQAVLGGRPHRIKELLNHNPQLVRARSNSGHRSTLLHYTACNGIEDGLQLSEENIYLRIHGSTGTERASLQQRIVDTVALLLEAGSEPDALCETYGGGRHQTPLNLLASSGHPDLAGVTPVMVELLCASGANPNGIQNDRSPLGTALGFGQLSTAKALHSQGAVCDNILFCAALGRLEKVQQYFDESGHTAEDLGVFDLGWFRLSGTPQTALEQALTFAALFGKTEVVRFLLNQDVNINAVPPGTHFTGSALHSACVFGELEVMQLLMDAGADPHLRDKRHQAIPLEWAQHCNQPEAHALLEPYTESRPS